MANEISIFGGMTLDNTKVDASKDFNLSTITQNAERYHCDVQNIGTSEEALGLGSISTVGYCIFHNCDATNYITIGKTGANDIIKLKAGEWVGPVRLGTNAPYAIANTAACELEYIIFED